MRTFAITNQKGGVGKTTTAVNVAAILQAEYKKRVLLVDLDPQGHSSVHVGRELLSVPPLVTILVLSEGKGRLSDHIVPTDFGFDLLPCSKPMALVDTSYNRSIKVLRTLLSEVADRYDYVILDCPPNLGMIVTLALHAADCVLVPMLMEYLPGRGLGELHGTIEAVKESHPDLKISGIFSIKTDEKTKLAKDVMDEIHSFFGNVLLETSVRRNIRLAEAPAKGQPCYHYERDCPGVNDFMALVAELVQRGVING